ncbi:MAG TPA: transcription termination factor Rho [Candidatus Lumbricidophila sp.]|nr:transcription termination factor Rho [Candidatus Lumbricidophila sp.]
MNTIEPGTFAAESLAGRKVAELAELAAELGISGGAKLRKGELIEQIIAATQAPETSSVDAAAEPVAEVDDVSTGPVTEITGAEASDVAEEADVLTEVAPIEVPAAQTRRGRGSRRATSSGAASQIHVNAGTIGVELVPAEDDSAARAAARAAVAEDLAAAVADESAEPGTVDAAEATGEPQPGEPRQGRSRNRRRGRGNSGNGAGGDQATRPAADADGDADSEDRGRQQIQNQNQNQAGQGQNNGGQDGEGRRGRYRDRKRRGPGDDADPEILDDDVLIPIAGILDVLENYAFVRTSGYLPGPSDVYVSLGQVKKYHLRKGDAVVGAIKQPRDGEQNSRQKYNALVKVDSINGLRTDAAATRVEFAELTPLSPQDRLRLETEPSALTGRVIDLIAPIGKGQRALIAAPPKTGKTEALRQIANAISTNNPEVHLMVVLVDERPEEVTEMQRSVKGEVIASTFDSPAEDHTTIADLAIERAKRLVELGHDVVVLLDSLTRLARAYNLSTPASGKVLAGGIDAAALYPPKRFFGAARNIENGGSLTIVATAQVETGSLTDEAIFEEFNDTANAELRLSRDLAEKRVFPAIDVKASSTRREELLLSADEVKIVWKLRRGLAEATPQAALENILGTLRETGSNTEFLLRLQKS